MSLIFDWLFAQYHGVPTHLVVLEIIAVIFGFLSVWFSKRENILVYPTGIISTAIFVYILWIYALLGDMLINAYYFSMSIYGWWIWTRKVDDTHFLPITKTTSKEKKKGRGRDEEEGGEAGKEKEEGEEEGREGEENEGGRREEGGERREGGGGGRERRTRN